LGYNNTEPIAKIEGAIYNNIKDNAKVISIINASDDDALNPNNEGTLINSLDNLRTDDAFKDYQTTTYSYDPLKGITSVTSPSGIRQVYIYDTAGRLKEIREAIKTGNLLKEFNYNYAPTTHYNSEKSGNFTKYCGGSGIGSSFTYIVAPNTYSSIISQADADQKAQNDVNANGQNAANNNPSGTCTPFTCNLSFNTSIGISGGGSVSVQSNGYYKASFGFSSGSNSTNLPWMTTGVKVATISGSCLPTTEYSSYNGQVYYTIKTNGDVILRSQSTAPGNNTSYSYDIIFPIN
jgi:YD repeat-containing protein